MKTFIALLFFITSAFANLPSWVSDSSKECQKSELCAVGEGESRTQASRNARVALSKIFENQISSTFSSTLSSSKSGVQESAEENIEELTSMALEGVEIKKTAESKTSYFALAVINKRKAASGFEREIKKLDEQMESYYSQAQTDSAAAVKLEELYHQREVLNKRYAFLAGKDLPTKLDFASIFKTKKEALSNMVLHIYLDEDEPKNVETFLVKVLGQKGYKTTTGATRNKNATHIVTGEFVAEKMYMNVDGFEKYKFLLKLTSSDTAKVQKGALSFETTETGRDYTQATMKAIEKVQEYIEANINKLAI